MTLVEPQPVSFLPGPIAPPIRITETGKSADKTFVTYTILSQIGGIQVEAVRRYSDFDTFRTLLVRLYPTTVVPPIPEKPSLAEYATSQGKVKDDPEIILMRKNMLQDFLNRLAFHPVLNRDHIYHRFIQGSDTWTEILNSSGYTNLLKQKDSISPLDKSSIKKSGIIILNNLKKNVNLHWQKILLSILTVILLTPINFIVVSRKIWKKLEKFIQKWVAFITLGLCQNHPWLVH